MTLRGLLDGANGPDFLKLYSTNSSACLACTMRLAP